jgi:hypothetical protein
MSTRTTTDLGEGLSGSTALVEKWLVLGRHEQTAVWLQIWTDLGRAPRTIDAYAPGTEPAIRIFDRPTVQLDLHPSYRQRRRVDIRSRDGAGIHRRVFDHCSALLHSTRCRPSPCAGLSPTRSTTTAPPAPTPFDRRRTYPPTPTWPTGMARSGSQMVPTFTAARSTGEAPGFTPAASWLRRRPSP